MAVWFTYNGLPANASSPTSYTLIGGTPTCPSGSNRVCAIFADPDLANYPIITDQLQNNIIDALNSRTSIPGAVLLKV